MQSKTLKQIIDEAKVKCALDEYQDIVFDLQAETARLAIKSASKDKIISQQQDVIQTLSSKKPSNNNVNKKSLIDVVEEYLEFQIERMQWTENVKRQRVGYFEIFADILGRDRSISSLNLETITLYQRTLRKLPKNVNKHFVRPKCVAERPIHYKELADSKSELPKLSAGGLESHFDTIKPFLKWCEENNYIEKAYLHILKISKSETVKTKTGVLPFSKLNLQKMFESYIYSDNRIAREKPAPYHFWMPLLGLWTGARLTELATLRVSDIKCYGEVLYIDINDEDANKRLKTTASKRRVPVAQALINAGFEQFVEQRQKGTGKNNTPLFDLPSHRDGVSRSVSKWFNENFKVKCALETPDKTKVVFHSFRHTFINKMRSTRIGSDLVPNRIIAEIVGHETGVVTDDVYGHEHDLSVLKEAIDNLNFEIDFSSINFERFTQRK